MVQLQWDVNETLDVQSVKEQLLKWAGASEMVNVKEDKKKWKEFGTQHRVEFDDEKEGLPVKEFCHGSAKWATIFYSDNHYGPIEIYMGCCVNGGTPSVLDVADKARSDILFLAQMAKRGRGHYWDKIGCKAQLMINRSESNITFKNPLSFTDCMFDPTVLSGFFSVLVLLLTGAVSEFTKDQGEPARYLLVASIALVIIYLVLIAARLLTSKSETAWELKNK